MKLVFLVFVTLLFSQLSFAAPKQFRCTPKEMLWNVIDEISFTYDSAKQSMKMSYELDGAKNEMSGTVDKSFKSKTPGTVRFLNDSQPGSSDFPELTSESYYCEILAQQALVQPNSKGGALLLRCRGESFEVGYYNCK